MEKTPKLEIASNVLAAIGSVAFIGMDLMYHGLRGGGWVPKG